MAWLYVPVQELSNSASSSSSASDYEPWLTLSGKATRRAYSWRGWLTRPWILRLSGTISQPSTATYGVALWIASLRASRASQQAMQADELASVTSAGSGQTSRESSARWPQQSSFLRTSEDSSTSMTEPGSWSYSTRWP